MMIAWTETVGEHPDEKFRGLINAEKLATALLIVSLVCPAYAGSDCEDVLDMDNKAVEMFQTKGKDVAITYVSSTMRSTETGALYVFGKSSKVRRFLIPFSQQPDFSRK